MGIIIGSARHDEYGNYTNGSAGDQLQSGTPDYSGEVSMQDMYTHSKGWYILRPISPTIADKIAERMIAACNNSHIGYDQNGRYGIISYGIDTTTNTECDCSSLVRECVKEASGVDSGDFTTETEPSVLYATGLFHSKVAYVNQSTTPVYNGDVLVTQSKGHTVVVCSGSARPDATEAYDEGWVKDDIGWWWRNSDGSWPYNCWKAINDYWYLFGANGYMLTGWQQWDGANIGSGDWYYLEGNNDEGYEGACWHEKSGGYGALERWKISAT